LSRQLRNRRPEPGRATGGRRIGRPTLRLLWTRIYRACYHPPRMPDHSTVLTVLNLKGGVGKTHTAWLLASVCQERKKRILLIDTDTQGNLSGSFGKRDATPGIEALFDPAAEPSPTLLIHHTTFSHIDLIPAG